MYDTNLNFSKNKDNLKGSEIMKKFFSLLLIAAILVSMTSCMTATPKDFTYQGMTVTLTNRFKEMQYEGYTVCYGSPDVMVIVLKESFSLQAGLDQMTLDEYAKLVHQANASKSPSEITKHEGFQSMEYDFLNEKENKTYSYFSTMFKGTDAFWLIQFACLEKDYEANKDTFLTYANSIKFSN